MSLEPRDPDEGGGAGTWVRRQLLQADTFGRPGWEYDLRIDTEARTPEPASSRIAGRHPDPPCAAGRIAPVATFAAVVDDFDLVVIGSGPAGDKGASQAAYFGHSVAMVERRKDVGGSAIQVSGVPVKALRDTAVYLTGWSRRDVYGVGISLAPDLIMKILRTRITDVVTTMQAAVATNLEWHGVELVHGTARLAPGDGERLAVVVTDDAGSERQLSARRVLLATGSRPFHAPDVPFDDPDVHDSEGILAIDRLPEHLVVVGGGAVGAEYASIFADLGSMVTVVSRGTRLLPTLDHEISEALADSLRESGRASCSVTPPRRSRATSRASVCTSAARCSGPTRCSAPVGGAAT